MTCKTKECKHQRDITYDCHISCEHPKIQEILPIPNTFKVLASLGNRMTFPIPDEVSKALGVVGTEAGIREGWFNWPFNFDPLWLESCNGFEEVSA